MASTKKIFILKNIDIPKVVEKYNITSDIILNIEDKNATKTTKISDLNLDKNETITFLDESKRAHKCMISMVDFNTKADVVNMKYNCYWDRHPFTSKPIGCPIRYVPSQAIKTYHSHISRDQYTIKENITNRIGDVLEEEGNEQITIKKCDYYETDGIFCSFNCCKSFIMENSHNSLYKNSLMLLLKMYNDMTGGKVTNIINAPHWRLLESYGGNMTITKFRENLNKNDYEFYGETRSYPKFLSIGMMFEENTRF